MKNFFSKESASKIALPLILLGVFIIPSVAHANWATSTLITALGWLAQMILKVVSLLTYMSGMLLNAVIRFTVVDMASYISKNGAVTGAWGTIRDVSNMAFIFVLLYAGIKMIIGAGRDAQRLIVNVIVVAILINFSLFFTKVIIDASNILAMFFYGAMAPDALTSTNAGLANSLMQPLKLQSIWNATEGITGDKLLIIGVMGSIVALIAAFVFFAITIMFIIRFVALVFVMILSPLAFMAYVLPDLKKYRDQWWSTLIGQSFFAPIYFMLTWVVLRIVESISLNTGGTWSQAFAGEFISTSTGQSTGNIELVLTFLVVIALLIATLIISKNYADKAGGLVNEANKWATGFAGGAAFGTAGWASRRTLGRVGERFKDDERLKASAAQGGARGMASRLALATAKKASTSTFDARGSGVVGQLSSRTKIDFGKAGGKGGYAETLKNKQKKYKERYGSFKPSGDAKKAADAEAAEKKKILEEAQKSARTKFETLMPKSEEHVSAEKKLEELRSDTMSALRPEYDSEVKAAEESLARESESRARLQEEFVSHKTEEEKKAHEEAEKKRSEMKDRMENMARRMERGLRGGIIDGREKAKAIRSLENKKSAKDKAPEFLRELMDEGVIPKPEDKPEA